MIPETSVLFALPELQDSVQILHKRGRERKYHALPFATTTRLPFPPFSAFLMVSFQKSYVTLIETRQAQPLLTLSPPSATLVHGSSLSHLIDIDYYDFSRFDTKSWPQDSIYPLTSDIITRCRISRWGRIQQLTALFPPLPFLAYQMHYIGVVASGSHYL